MTDARFEKLVNLYLDKEITPSELSDLKSEIAHNLVRRQKFERLCRVHSASRKALISHSANSGISTFLHEQVNTVESKRGSRTRVRKAKSEEEVRKEARDNLWRGTLAFIGLILAAGVVTAYLLDRSVSSYNERVAKEQKKDNTLDPDSFQQGVSLLKNGNGFILAGTPLNQGSRIGQLYILRWEPSNEISLMGTDSSGGQWTITELNDTLPPTEAYIIEMQLKRCAGQMPGTSAPAAIPMPSQPVLLTNGQTSLLQEP